MFSVFIKWFTLIFAPIGFLANFLLFICINDNFAGKYDALIRTFSVHNMIWAIVRTLVESRYAKVGRNLVLYSKAYLPKELVRILLCFETSFLVSTPCIVAVHFYYRHRVIFDTKPSTKHFERGLAIIPFLCAFVWGVTQFVVFGENPETSKIMMEQLELLEIQNQTEVVYFAIGTTSNGTDIVSSRIAGIVLGLGLMISAIVSTSISIFRTNRAIRTNVNPDATVMYDEAVKNERKALFTLLNAQIVLPSILLYVPAIILLDLAYLNWDISIIAFLFNLTITSFNLIDPILIFVAVKSYRVRFFEFRDTARQKIKRAIRRVFCCKKSSDEPRTSVYAIYSQGEARLQLRTGTHVTRL